MEQKEDQIKGFLETFFQATQIEALYFDCQMNLVSCHFREYAVESLLRLSMGRVESFLRDIFDNGRTDPKNLYTYYLDQNLICNISVLYDHGQCRGAAVTQPVSLNILKKADIEAKLRHAPLPQSGEHGAYILAMQRAPVVSHDRIRCIGEILVMLSRFVFEEAGCHQVLCGGQADPARYRFLQSGKLPNQGHTSSFPNKRHGGYQTYRQIKDAISRGDAEALQGVFNNFNFGSVHLDQQTSKDAVRSLKNGFIEGFAMCCFIAVEAGAPYGKTRDLTEAFIKELENTENVADMYRLMQSALLAFTRAVAVTHIAGHSRPVRQAVEYIETHYPEKITLKLLAEQVNLSEFYLSTLVKKETGSNIADIINKVRIEESKAILRQSTVSISRLSAMVGYSYSNHFSRVFKQHTGMTPSEYARMSRAPADAASTSKEMMNMLLDQLRHYMLMFPGVFDVIRIVDPVSSLAWKTEQGQETVAGPCYAFWGRNQSCEKCISLLALEQGKPFVKLDQGQNNRFLVFAVPAALGGKKYLIELLKSVADNYLDCLEAPASVTGP